MARHNREGHGSDQRGYEYRVSYQPDWLRYVKVSRALESGRQSTKTLVRNPAGRRVTEAGERVRTRIVCEEQDLDVHVAFTDPNRSVVRVRIACEVTGPDGGREQVEFTLMNELDPPRE